MADVFISYSQQSASSAETLAEALSARGLEVWWDTRLASGDRFDDVIRSELDLARAAIVIWSPASVASKYVKMEAGIAFGWNKLITVRTADLAPGDIPVSFRDMHADLVTDLERIIAALAKKGVEPRSVSQRKRMTVDEILDALSRIDLALPGKLLEWLKQCQAAGFRVVASRSLIVKSDVPRLGDVNFGTIFPDGTLQTNYISESAARIGDASIAADYLDGVAKLIEGATVRREGAPWTWRVEVFGALPAASKLLERGDEWLALMREARCRFIEAQTPAPGSATASAENSP